MSPADLVLSQRVSRRRRLVFLLTASLALWSMFALWSPRQETTSAAPHTISQVDHPYDPDWPDVYRILNEKCASCHRRGGEQSDWTSYENLMVSGHDDDLPAVVPGKPEKSYLWKYVNWNVEARVDSDSPDQPEMPPNRDDWLTAGQLKTVYRWLKNGAHQFRLPEGCKDSPLTEIDFPTAKQCGACHSKQYAEWSRSMHAYAQHSPTFEAFNLTLVERTGGTIGTFCSRCHTPLGTAIGENASLRNVHRSRLSMEGITCVVCHRRKDGHYKASGRLAIEAGKMLDGCEFGPFDDPVSESIGAHPAAASRYIKSSQFCAECHDVISPEGVRLEEAFSEWHNSPAAKQGFTCQHCHMGPVQGVPIADDRRPLGRAAEVPGVDPKKLPLRRLSDHTFAGPDYSLLPDTEFPHKLDWMYETDYRDPSKLTPYQQKTLKDLRRRNREHLRIAAQKRYELLSNAAEISVNHSPRAQFGEKIDICVDVTSKFAGHSLPTGFTAERQMWVAIEVCDSQGQVVFRSGDFDNNGDLRNGHSHDVLSGKIPRDKYLLSFQNLFTALTHKGSDRTVPLSVNRYVRPLSVLRPATEVASSFGRPSAFRVAKGSLPPLKTIGRKYPLRLPPCGGVYHVSVRLNFRHLPPNLLDHIGVPHLKPQLEVVELDRYDGVIHVAP